MISSRPVQWFELIRDMETFTAETGWGLARTWGDVHREDYDAARSGFDAVLADFRHAGRRTGVAS